MGCSYCHPLVMPLSCSLSSYSWFWMQYCALIRAWCERAQPALLWIASPILFLGPSGVIFPSLHLPKMPLLKTRTSKDFKKVIAKPRQAHSFAGGSGRAVTGINGGMARWGWVSEDSLGHWSLRPCQLQAVRCVQYRHYVVQGRGPRLETTGS